MWADGEMGGVGASCFCFSRRVREKTHVEISENYKSKILQENAFPILQSPEV